MLDVLEDWIHEHGWPVERIDGSVTGRDRQQAIDRYTNSGWCWGGDMGAIRDCYTNSG